MNQDRRLEEALRRLVRANRNLENPTANSMTPAVVRAKARAEAELEEALRDAEHALNVAELERLGVHHPTKTRKSA